MNLSNNFVKYKDLLTINGFDEETNKEEIIFLPKEGNSVVGRYLGVLNMLDYGDSVPVRKTVYEKLRNIDKNLKEINKDYSLLVVYGYRSLENQTKYFNEEYNKAKDKFNDELELLEYVHEKVAVPTVAGHPTGGAVDICIFDNINNEIIDFGSEMHDFSTNDCYTFSNNISDIGKENRMLLRNLMIKEGFAPYDGEWWHFSYVDKEWAFYYKKNKALYNQLKTTKVYGG